VTPFDPQALLVMLLTFYPIVSAAELRHARAERPEYFAAGELFGSKGDKLLLPDGRAFDLIFAAGGLPGQQRWQVIEAGPGGDGDGFGLEAGPLVPLDETGALPPLSDLVFESLVAGAIGDVVHLDGRMGDAASEIVAAVGEENVGPLLDEAFGDAQSHHEQSSRSLEGVNPGELVDATDGLFRQIDSRVDELPAPPADIPENPPTDPGPAPGPTDEPPEQGPPEA
jgi:hypothetical protein